MSDDEVDYDEEYDGGAVPETPMEVPSETGRRLMQQLNPMQQRAAEQKRKEEVRGEAPWDRFHSPRHHRHSAGPAAGGPGCAREG